MLISRALSFMRKLSENDVMWWWTRGCLLSWSTDFFYFILFYFLSAIFALIILAEKRIVQRIIRRTFAVTIGGQIYVVWNEEARDGWRILRQCTSSLVIVQLVVLRFDGALEWKGRNKKLLVVSRNLFIAQFHRRLSRATKWHTRQ